MLAHDGFRSVVMVPLVAKGESIGLVELFSRKLLTFDERRRDLARAMANESAMALANAQLYETARAMADRDPLTGFFNHRYLQERLNEEILRAQRTREPLAILMIDLDDFKLVNDTLGHLFGDEVLAWVAEQIRAALRTSDIPARYGGDEFAVILPSTTATGARAVGDRILAGLDQAAFRAPHRGPVPVGASIGIAAYPLDGPTARDLISTADARLYRVKRTGGGGVEARVGRRHGPRPSSRPLKSVPAAAAADVG
jgi:diguanylate cyclase (GGDEF)-like protein